MRVQGIALKCVITIEVILYKYSRQKPGPHQKQPQSKITTMLMHIIDISWNSWAEAPIKIARMILTIKLDGTWSSFQLANSAPPLSVTGSAIALSARMHERVGDLAPSAVESHKPPASLPKRGSGRDACGSASVDTPTTSSCYP